MPLSKHNNIRVVILGAGIAGLASAYELRKAGYDVVVLEASHRAGGRNLTLRHGDIVDEMGHPQRCDFDAQPNLYFNAGPARIPANHHLLLHYCKALGIELQVFVNDNRNAWVQDDGAFGGNPVRNRAYMNDARGFMTELMAKSLRASDLDTPMTGEDIERLFGFIRRYGDLDEKLLYKGSLRAGHTGGMLAPATKGGTLDFSEILKSEFWHYKMHFAEMEDQTAPMMQPVGGMDKLVEGFIRFVGSSIITQAKVTAIKLGDHHVDIEYTHKGRTQYLRADYCLNNIPSHLVTGLDHNLPQDYADVLMEIKRGILFKIGLQASERFWEKESIYGGISWTSQDITQIWYPCHDIHHPKGILLGAYTFGEEEGMKFGLLPPAQRLELAIQQGEKIHPQYRRHIENGVSVAWHRMNHMMGCSANWTEAQRARHFHKMQQPVGRHYMIGDQISYHPGWQEGALSSAHFTLGLIDQHVRATG